MSTPAQLVTLARHAMATRFELALWGGDAASLRAAGEEALDEIERLEAQLSFFRPGSEVSALNARAAREAVPVDPRFFALLERLAALHAATEGAFDPTVAPLVRLWRRAAEAGAPPEPEAVAEALARRGMDALRLEPGARTVRFAREGVALELGAVGKGYAVDRAVRLLRDAGVESALLHGGTSTAFALGAPPGEPAWRVAIRSPEPDGALLRTVSLREAALSVSAGHGRAFTVEGANYGHVLDPRTGWPVQGALLAAVVGPEATAADALSTALLVLGEEGLPLLAERFPDYRALLALRAEGGALRLAGAVGSGE